MASLAKAKYFGPARSPRNRSQPAVEKPTKISPDYWALAVLLLLMLAVMGLAMWLASLGGGALQPVDYWMLTP
jgi:hypothetical protein